MTIYLDWNSTGIIHSKVLKHMSMLWSSCYNSSSAHKLGQNTRKLLTASREKIQNYLNAKNTKFIFTSGSTESNVGLIRSWQLSKAQIFVSASEHPSIINANNLHLIPLYSSGLVDIDALKNILPQFSASKVSENSCVISNYTFLVSIALANSETGIIQNIKKIAKIVHDHGGYIHIDATQAFGRISIDFTDLNVDYMTISAHKVGGPIGVGALISKLTAPLQAINWGGDQEMNIRSGTLATPLICGWSSCIFDFLDDYTPLSHDEFEALLLRDSSLHIVGYGQNRLPNTTSLISDKFNASELAMALDVHEIAVSVGSACTSGRLTKSKTLQAMNIDREAIRISSGWKNSSEDLKKCAKVILNLSKE